MVKTKHQKSETKTLMSTLARTVGGRQARLQEQRKNWRRTPPQLFIPTHKKSRLVGRGVPRLL